MPEDDARHPASSAMTERKTAGVGSSSASSSSSSSSSASSASSAPEFVFHAGQDRSQEKFFEHRNGLHEGAAISTDSKQDGGNAAAASPSLSPSPSPPPSSSSSASKADYFSKLGGGHRLNGKRTSSTASPPASASSAAAALASFSLTAEANQPASSRSGSGQRDDYGGGDSGTVGLRLLSGREGKQEAAATAAY